MVKKYLKFLLYIIATVIVLPMTGCLCSQLYTRHQVSKLMNYQGMNKSEALRRICEVDIANYDSNPPDYHGFITPACKIEIHAEHIVISGESYDDLKNHDRLLRSNKWVIHGRNYGISMRHYAIELTFDKEGIVTKQELTYYIRL